MEESKDLSTLEAMDEVMVKHEDAPTCPPRFRFPASTTELQARVTIKEPWKGHEMIWKLYVAFKLLKDQKPISRPTPR